jgi:hypothetical protein
MDSKKYEWTEFSFEYPGDGTIIEMPQPDGTMQVRFKNKEDNKTAIRIEVEPLTGSKSAEDLAKDAFQDRDDFVKDAKELAPHELKDTKEKGWRVRKWMLDGAQYLGIFDYAFLEGKGKRYRIYYFTTAKLFDSGQAAFEQIVKTFEIK